VHSDNRPGLMGESYSRSGFDSLGEE